MITPISPFNHNTLNEILTLLREYYGEVIFSDKLVTNVRISMIKLETTGSILFH